MISVRAARADRKAPAMLVMCSNDIGGMVRQAHSCAPTGGCASARWRSRVNCPDVDVQFRTVTATTMPFA
jgi:hypothetical protein